MKFNEGELSGASEQPEEQAAHPGCELYHQESFPQQHRTGEIVDCTFQQRLGEPKGSILMCTGEVLRMPQDREVTLGGPGAADDHIFRRVEGTPCVQDFLDSNLRFQHPEL